MSYVIEVADGNLATTVRNNPILTATARIDAISNFGTGFGVGDVVKVAGNPVPANDGIYLVAALITGTRVFDVAEGGIATAAGGGTVTWYSNESATLQASVAITNFLAGSVIEAVGANFLTAGVRKGDTAFVLGAGTTLSGLWRVVEVLSATQIRVAGASKGKTAFGASAGAGTVEVKGGSWLMTVTDEAAPTWALARSGATGPDGSVGADFITQRALGDRLTLFLTHGLRRVTFVHTVNAATVWVSEREVVIADRADAVTGEFRYGSGSSPGDLVRIGRAGSDRYGADFASSWIGWRPNVGASSPGPADSLGCSIFGSAVHAISATGAGSFGTGNEGSFVASLIDGYQAIAPGGTGAVAGAVFTGTIESCINRSSGFSVALFGAPDSYDNWLVTESGTAGVTISVTGFVQGLLASVDVATPFFQLLDSFVTVLNPRADYALSELFSIFSGEGYLDYTWAPRFVERGAGVPIPIAGLSVRLFSIDEATLVETELGSSPFTTDVNGRIPASGPGASLLGSGVDLNRGRSEPLGVETLFSHRVIVEGAGYRRLDAVFTMRAAKIDFDLPIDILRTDYEGELST